MLIDCALDFNTAWNRIEYTSCDKVLEFVQTHQIEILYILETHVHADHISGAPYVKSKLPNDPPVCIGSRISEVQQVFSDILELKDSVSGSATEFDQTWKDGDEFKVGSLNFQVMHTPGHTPACACYKVGDAIFTGDTIFHSSIGTARCDFPGGSAETMYASVQKILALPPSTRLYWGHDYPGQDREFQWGMTIAEVKATNKQVKDGTDEATYINARTTRDAGLRPPGLIYQSLQVNIRAGRFPEPVNGKTFLKMPLTL